MNLNEVEIVKIENQLGKQLADNFYSTCCFCKKTVNINSDNFYSCSNLSKEKFFCPFCLRNNFNYLEKDICVFSFKGILAYYYYVFYKKKSTFNLYYSQIKNYIEIHQEVGLNNPVFYYDPQTFLWFINFDKIGKKTHKAPIEEVKKTANNIFDCLEVDRFFNSFATNKLRQEFENCLISFNKQRNDKITIPLLEGSEAIEESFATRFCLSKFEII